MYAIEYCQKDCRNRGLWTGRGVFAKADDAYSALKAIHPYSEIYSEDGQDLFKVQDGDIFKINAIPSLTDGLELIFKAKFGDYEYQWTPVYELVNLFGEKLALTNSVWYNDQIQLLFDQKTNFRKYVPYNPWQLNIKEVLCTP